MGQATHIQHGGIYNSLRANGALASGNQLFCAASLSYHYRHTVRASQASAQIPMYNNGGMQEAEKLAFKAPTLVQLSQLDCTATAHRAQRSGHFSPPGIFSLSYKAKSGGNYFFSAAIKKDFANASWNQPPICTYIE